jgi:hypothetical protein
MDSFLVTTPRQRWYFYEKSGSAVAFSLYRGAHHHSRAAIQESIIYCASLPSELVSSSFCPQSSDQCLSQEATPLHCTFHSRWHSILVFGVYGLQNRVKHHDLLGDLQFLSGLHEYSKRLTSIRTYRCD